MNISQPNNEAEAAYLGFAIVDELIHSLVSKGVISGSDADQVFRSVAVRLSKGGSFESQRAAKFLANWIKLKE